MASSIAARLAHLSPFSGSANVVSGPVRASARAAFAQRHTSRGVGRTVDGAVVVEGRGSWLRTDCDEVLLDMTSGIGVTSLGHAHPEVAAAVAAQAHTANHIQANVAWHGPQLDLIERLLRWCPEPLDRFFFWNSGAEAVEAALKLARHATGKQNVIVMQGGYHGRTIGTMSLTTSRTSYREGFGPLMPGVAVAPFPYWHTCGLSGPPPPGSAQEQAMVEQASTQLELVLKQQSAPSETAAVLIEPVMGEGGYVPAPPAFMRAVRETCTANDLLLICDEVQTGFGRTGEKFAMEHHSGVVPDVLVFAKGIANGYPLSGIASRFELMESQPPGSMGGTYAGNAVSCVAACTTIDVMERDNVLENVQARGQQLRRRLEALQADEELEGAVADVRGLGLMVGVELGPSAGTAKAVANECLERGMVLLTTGMFETLRFIPPLNVTEAELDVAVDIFDAALRATLRS